jgi:AcrR family transcriptional regulator
MARSSSAPAGSSPSRPAGSSSVGHSAKGTRLNRRGLKTRQNVLRAALRSLADGGPEAASASSVARVAGATWGTVQHQFGDVDGLWAAVLEHVLTGTRTRPPTFPDSPDVAVRVEAVLDLLWDAMDQPASRAIHHLRLALPQGRAELEAAYPRTAEAIAHWDEAWTATVAHAFDGLEVDPGRLSRVRSLLPGAMRGLHSEQHLSTYTDPAEARAGLAGAITAYLSERSGEISGPAGPGRPGAPAS